MRGCEENKLIYNEIRIQYSDLVLLFGCSGCGDVQSEGEIDVARRAGGV